MLATDRAAFKASVLADNTLSAAVTAQDWPTIAIAYNAPSSPAVMLWRPNVPIAELNNAIDWTGDANGFLLLSVAKQNAYFALTQGGTVDATQVNVRNGFGAIFPASVASALATIAQVQATRFQALFSAGSVSSYFGVTLGADDVQKAMG